MGAKVLFQSRSSAGATFSVQPALVSSIEAKVDEIAAEIADKRKTGLFIGYMSTPVSPRGGGDFRTNTMMAAHTAKRVQEMFGPKLWVLDPAAYNLPKGAGGGDYMAMWAQVLGGEDGSGSAFDLVYFVGPNDIRDFFGVGDLDRIGAVERWLQDQASTDSHYKNILDDARMCRNFLRFYGIRASSAYSKGAHDEWNLFADFNARRDIGDTIAVYFDGRPVEPGGYEDRVVPGYRLID